MSMASCSGDKSASTDTLTDFNDSLSYTLGQVQGNYTLASLTSLPDELSGKIDKEKFYEGFCAALNVDTAHIARVTGADHGAGIWQQIQIMKHAGVPVDIDMMLSGFSAGINADTTDTERLDQASDALFGLMNDVNSKILEFQRRQQEKMLNDAVAVGKKNEAAGRDYVAKQRISDESLKIADSGLVYKEIRAGKGPKPTADNNVKVIYTGSLVDGTVFDSSNGEAVEFPVKGVIPGFREALMMMNKGAQYHIIIPADLGYGLQAPPTIGPNSYLVFDLELVDILPGNN